MPTALRSIERAPVEGQSSERPCLPESLEGTVLPAITVDITGSGGELLQVVPQQHEFEADCNRRVRDATLTGSLEMRRCCRAARLAKRLRLPVLWRNGCVANKRRTLSLWNVSEKDVRDIRDDLSSSPSSTNDLVCPRCG
jgi:hypothetical protein